MHNALTKYVALLMLAMFMTGIGSVSTNSFVHDLQHDNAVKHPLVVTHLLSHHHVSQTANNTEAAGIDTDSNNIDISEHLILHALNHLQFFPDMSLADLSVLPLLNAVPLQFDRPFLPLADIELPLRPPQSNLLPA